MKQIEFLKNLEQLQFTGQWVQAVAGGRITLYLAQGRIIYATGGLHPIRRWRRHLLTYCPCLPTYRLAWQIDLAKVADPDLSIGWEYALLKLWVTQQRITQAQAKQLIQATVVELLFDLAQAPPQGAEQITGQLQRAQRQPLLFEPMPLEVMLGQAISLQQQWQQVGLGCYPDQAPVIQQPEPFRQWTAAHGHQALVRLVNGQRTLRDLATDWRHDLIETAQLILHCVQLGFLELTSTEDLPGLVFRRTPSPDAPLQTAEDLPQPTFRRLPSQAAPSQTPEAPPKALIACIDDSLMVRKMMEELLTSASYQFLGIEDPLRVIGLLLARKPEFIFLDLIMPHVNGYELCEKLRKLSCFRHTPIVILTGNDGYANRLRSNFAGATAFLAKPLNAEAVLSMIDQHLQIQQPPASPVPQRSLI